MANVIRQDVVQIGFDIDNNALTKLDKQISAVAKSLTGNMPDGAFAELAEGADDASKNVKKIGDSLKNIGKATGLSKVAEHLNNTDTKAGKAYAALKKVASVAYDKTVAGLKKIGSALGTITKKAAKYAAVGVGAAATGVGAIVAQSVKSYADYEQLVGGVDTLFKDSSATVQKYANDAYKTAGLSANTYMETATSFSASLLQSLGGDTAKAADYANTAITDMSDNANKMGTSMDSLIQTYQSLSRGNFAMLDNLKLGYGGTKEEMKRLIKDAAKLDKSVKANDMSFGNMVKAIHAVQDNMGITGTTAKEASSTISGSLASMKSAWSNLLTSVVTGGDSFDQCVDNMIASAETFGKNIMPAIEKGLQGIGKLVEKLAPIIAEKLPELISTLLPPLVKAAGTLLASLVSNLPAIIASLMPAIKEAMASIVKAIYEAFTGKEMSTEQFDKLKTKIDGLAKTAKIAIPVIIGLVGAFKLFKGISSAVKFVKSFSNSVGKITQSVTGGVGEKISSVGDSIQKTGTKSKNSSKNMLASAKAFMMLAAAVLMISIGFGVLAFSAISLANAGGAAIAVMFGLVVALAALGFGMALLLKTISSVGAKAIPAATAMVILGAAIILVAVGFAIMAQAAIALAGAGGAAIGVMFGMLAAIAVLVVIVGLFGGALIAGAVGFVIFAAGLLLCAAAAYVFALAVQVMTPPLLALIPVVGQVVTMIVNAVGTVLVNCIQAAGTAISGILDSIGNIFLNFGEGVKTIVEGIGNAISGVLDSIAGIIDSIGNAALNAGLGFEKVANGLRMISELSLTDLITSVGAVAKALSDVAQHGEGLQQAGQGMQTLVSGLMLLAGAAEVATAGLITLGAAVQSTQAVFGASFDAMVQKTQSSTMKIIMLITQMLVKITALFKATNLQSVGEQMMNGLIRGMESKKQAAVNTARDIANAINREYENIQRIASPSKVWTSYGEYQIEGNIVGMENKLPELRQTARDMGQEAIPYSSRYSGERATYTTNRSSRVENNSYSPVFNFNISGSGDTRATARAVKKAAREAVSEMFESMNRRTPSYQTY